MVVVNAGDNYLLAQALHRAIRARTDQPVRYVVLENGQGQAGADSAHRKKQSEELAAGDVREAVELVGLMRAKLGFPARRVIGMAGALDSARFCWFIAVMAAGACV